MPSNKDTKKKLPEILDKFASNSEKATKQLGEMSSQLSAFVDMLSENVQKESRRKDTEDRRRKKARKVKADAAEATAASAAATELQQARNEYAEAVKGLAQLDKDEIKKSKQKAKQKETDKLKEQQKERQQKIGELKQKGTPYSDIANKNFSGGNILGGLFASIFAIKDVSNKRKLSSLEEDEKEYNKQQEERNAQENEDQEKETEADLKQKRLEEKKKLQESVTKLQGSEKPAASVSPSKITNPEDQIVAETIKLNDEDKLEQSQEQTKRLGTLDENISKIWTDHLQVSIVDISDPAIDKFKGIFSGLEASQNKSGGLLSEILGFSKFLPEIMPALTTLGTTYLAPLLIPLAAIAIAAAVWKGLAWLLNKDAEEAQARGLKEQAAKLSAAKSATNRESDIARNTVKDQAAQAITLYGDTANTSDYAEYMAKEAEKNGNKTLAAAWYEEGRSRLAKQTTAAAPTATTTDDQPVVDVPAPAATTAPTPAATTTAPTTTAPTPAATTTTAPTTTAPKPAAAKPTAKPKPAAAPTPTPKSSSEEISKILKTGDGFNTVEMSDGTVQTRKGDRNWRNNNPGNIEWGPFAQSKGAIGTDGRFAIFPTYEMGRQAKSDLLFEGKNYKDLNIKQAISRYAPPKNNKGEFENDTPAYIKAVTSAVGGTENTNLRDLTSDQRVQFLTAVQKQEGFRPGKIITESPSTPQLLTSTPKTGVNVVAAMKNKAETEGGNPVTIAPITTNNVISGAKSGDELPYRDPRDYIRKAFNMDIFGSVTRSSAG